MIILTSDIHESKHRNADQNYIRHHHNLTEVEVAKAFIEKCSTLQISLTAFFTAQALKELSVDYLNSISTKSNLEIACHGKNSLRPRIKHVLYKMCFGRYLGNTYIQRRAINSALDDFKITGINFGIGWRTHAFKGDATTHDILNADDRILYIADWVEDYNNYYPNQKGSLLCLNTPPDHENFQHAVGYDSVLTKIYNVVRSFFTKKLITHGTRNYDDYKLELFDRVRSALDKDGYACILLHPACIMCVDPTFEILRELKNTFPSEKFVTIKQYMATSS